VCRPKTCLRRLVRTQGAARRLAERAIVLDQGRVVYAGGLGAFLADRERAHRHLGVALSPAGP